MPTLAQVTFAAGELTPALHGRPDLAKYQSGLKTARNVFAHTYGGISNRPGTLFVGYVPAPEGAPRLMSFQFGLDQNYVLVFAERRILFIKEGSFILGRKINVSTIEIGGPGGIRFTTEEAQPFHNGGLIYLFLDQDKCEGPFIVKEADNQGFEICNIDRSNVDTRDIGLERRASSSHVILAHLGVRAAKPYSVTTPYSGDQVWELKYTQSFDVIILTHPMHPPKKLERWGLVDWRFSDLIVAPTIVAPSSVKAEPNTPPQDVKLANAYAYQVTTLSENGEESLPSTIAICDNTLEVHAEGRVLFNRITWDAVPAGVRYRIYKRAAGTFGYIGATNGTNMEDMNLKPDMTITPPGTRNPFTHNNYPSAVAFHEQRLDFAGSRQQPQTIWMSGTANFYNFNVSTPAKADEAITITLASGQLNAIQHLVAMNDLWAFTTRANWRVSGGDRPLTHTTIMAKPQDYYGCTQVSPLIVGNRLLFVSPGNIVRSLNASDKIPMTEEQNENLSLLSAHLFEGHRIVDWAYAPSPYGLVWVVRDDGALLSLTYLPEHQVVAWCQQDTQDGAFEAVTVVSEGDTSVAYFVVRRTFANGNTGRFIERLAARHIDKDTAFFVDCGIRHRGTDGQRVLHGLHHLEGKSVVALVDGNVLRDLRVLQGEVTLPRPYNVAHVGLPYTAEIETLPLFLEGVPLSRPKRIASVAARVLNTRGVWAGSNTEHMYEVKPRSQEAWREPAHMMNGPIKLPVNGDWDVESTVVIQQRDPLPMTILSISSEATVAQ